MQDLNDKITGGTLSAAEWNQLPSEVQNVIEALGLVLTDADLDQLGKGIMGYAGAGSYMAESGVADAYVVNPIGSKQGPASLDANHDGLLVRFRPGNANTGASTINVNALGAKDLVREGGGAVEAGDLLTSRDAYVRWDFASDDFVLQDFTISGALEVSRGYIDGLITSNAADTANDITWGVGICRDQSNSATISLGSTITKQIDVDWVAGDNQGGFPSLLTRSVDTWYHLFILRNPVSGAIDAGFDSNLSATNLLSDATGFTQWQRVGAILTNATGLGEIIQYTQTGDDFIWNDSDVPDGIGISNPGTAEVVHTLEGVPIGLKVLADVSVVFGRPDGSGNTRYRIGPGDQTLNAAGTGAYDTRTEGDGRYGTVARKTRTNTAAQIKTRQDSSNANATVRVTVFGWQDPRGKDA